jgi:hypothetical protein
MNNIFLIPTDKASRLVLDDIIQQLRLVSKGEALWGNQNIYITSDEEIKSGDWCINLNSPYQHKELCRIDNQIELERYAQKTGNACRKIILTTDQDLIADGVQGIEDSFLEWFINNPTCEEVEVQKWFCGLDFLEYKIIIPQEKIKCYCGHTTTCDCGPEEPKQETLEEFPKEEPKQELNSLVESWQKKQKEYEVLAEKHRDCEHTYKKYTYRAQATRDCWKELLTFNKTTEGYYDDFKMIEGEKIEEAAENYSRITLNKNGLMSDKQVNGFIAGAKWQSKRMYSEEEVLEHLNHLIMMKSSELDRFTDDEEMVTMKWFERFKKK